MTLLGKIFNAIHDDESAEISSIDEKLSPSINDLLLIEDSEDGNNKKSVSIGNLPSSGGDYSGFGEVFVNLFSGSETTDENNWKSIGASEIDTAKFGFDGYFEAVLSSSDDAGAAELRLFNATTNTQIGDILEVNGEISFVSEQITLTDGINIYEAQLRSPDGYYAVCKNARVSFYKFILNAPDASEDGYVAIAQSGDLVYIGGETDGYVLTWNAGLNSWEPQEPTGTGGGGTLAETLVLGNSTSGNNIVATAGDVFIGGGTIIASTPGNIGSPGALALGITAGAGFDDGSLTLDGQGGYLQIHAGEGYGIGAGGSVDVAAGNANGVDADGGDVYLTSGVGIGTGRGGHVQCYVMPSDGTGNGGEFQVYIGYGDPEDIAFKVNDQGDGYFYNNLEIDGKLTVAGLIDPTGLVLAEQVSVPGGNPSIGNYTLWVRDDGYVLITNSSGETTTLSGSEGILQNLSNVLSIGNSANSQIISDLLDPINAQDAATKNYIDGYVGGLGGDLSGSLPNPEVTDLTITGEEQGSVLYFDGLNWVQLPPGNDGYALTTHGTGANPTWTISGSDIYAIHENVAGEISTITEKETPAATDLLIIEDSADSNNKKRIQISSIFSIPGLSGMMNDAFIATENQTSFTLSQSPSNNVAIMVVDGITQSSLDYTVSGTSITYSGLDLSAGQAVDFWYSLGTGSGNGGSGVQFISILSGIETHDLDGWKTVGIVEINSTEFTGTATLEAVLYTSDGYADGYARLYNPTTMTQIGSDLTTTNNLPTLLSSVITLTTGSNLYELQIRVEQDGTDEFVSCGMGRIKITGSSGGGGTVGETWISPDPLGSDVNDWNPTGFSTATIVRVDAVDDGYSITGFDASATVTKKEIINVSAYDLVISNQDTGSVATNRIISQTGGLVLASNDSMTIVYDPVTERWRVI